MAKLKKAPKTQVVRGVIGITTAFWPRVNAVLVERGITFAELARRTMYTRQYLARRIESRTMPSDVFLTLCRVLDLKHADYLTTEDWIPPPKPPETP